MQVTMQIKMPMDKAQRMQDRLLKVQAAARAKSEAVRAKVEKLQPSKAKHDAQKKWADAQDVEKDMTITNLFRALLDNSFEKILTLDDDKLMALLQSSQLKRGRPSFGLVGQ